MESGPVNDLQFLKNIGQLATNWKEGQSTRFSSGGSPAARAQRVERYKAILTLGIIDLVKAAYSSDRLLAVLQQVQTPGLCISKANLA